MRLAPQAQTVQVVSRSALPPVAEPAEIDRLVSASIGGGQPIYRLDTDAIRDLRPDVLLSQDPCAVCAVPSGHVNAALEVLGCQAKFARSGDITAAHHRDRPQQDEKARW
jgi:iron complex transport system substrate-binding protein